MSNLLITLHRLGRTRLFLVTLAVALAGLFLPGVWGALLLFVVVAALAALATQSWPATAPPLRVLRLVVMAALVVVAVAKIF